MISDGLRPGGVPDRMEPAEAAAMRQPVCRPKGRRASTGRSRRLRTVTASRPGGLPCRGAGGGRDRGGPNRRARGPGVPMQPKAAMYLVAVCHLRHGLRSFPQAAGVGPDVDRHVGSVSRKLVNNGPNVDIRSRVPSQAESPGIRGRLTGGRTARFQPGRVLASRSDHICTPPASGKAVREGANSRATGSGATVSNSSA